MGVSTAGRIVTSRKQSVFEGIDNTEPPEKMCKMGLLLASVDEEDKKILQRALESDAIPHAVLAKRIKVQAGYSLSEQVVRRHRSGTCCCCVLS